MATNSIAQAPDDVKRKCSATTSDKPAAESIEYLMGFHECDFDQNDHRVSCGLQKDMIAQIMSSSNEEALALLSSVGRIEFVPGFGDNSIPLNEFAGFYGVSEKYLRYLLYQRWCVKKLYPDDVTKTSLIDILMAKVPLTRCCGDEQRRLKDLATYYVNGSRCQQKVSLPENKMFNLYSPRLVLAAALMMVYTDKSDEVGPIKKTLLALKRSPYRFIKRTEEDPVDKVDHGEPIKGIPVTANGEFVLSPELFTHMIKTAVKEAVSEVMAEVRIFAAGQPAPASKRHKSDNAKPTVKQITKKVFPTKLEKPAEWETILHRWKSGSLSVSEAAKLAGMSEASFRNYANGKRVFD